jgi:hypothetical protein
MVRDLDHLKRPKNVWDTFWRKKAIFTFAMSKANKFNQKVKKNFSSTNKLSNKLLN